MRRLVCCRRRAKDISLDFDEHQRIVTTYNGLESILNSCAYHTESHKEGSRASGGDGCTITDSPDEDAASSCSSSKDAYGSSFSSQCMTSRQEEEQALIEWEPLKSLQNLCVKGKAPITYRMNVADVENMKERFAKLLLGEDSSGGANGMCTALALSNAIANLSASIFGELWKLEPLSEERKCKWRMEMDWLLSPTSYMVELVPAKQNGANGRMLEIMTPKARSDVHMSLPALQKLDSMLIEVLDSMVSTEFWYAEGGSRNNGNRQSKKWWLPSPRVPDSGLSLSQRKRLGFQGKFVYQVLKAAKSINEQIVLHIPIPDVVKDALPKSAKASLGNDIYEAITAESISVQEILISLNLRNEHSVLDIMNRLQGAIFAWKHSVSDESSKRLPIRYPWYFMKNNVSEIGKVGVWIERAEALVHLLNIRFPNLPQTFIDVTKVQYNKDVGYSIIEAYSRVLVNLSFSILSRIGDILQEDDLKKPTTPIATLKFDFFSDVYLAGITETPPGHIRRSLIDQMNKVDGRFCNSKEGNVTDDEDCFFDSRARIVTVTKNSPGRIIRGLCYGKGS
ncbi:rop guanine nucleotide exchange factor 14 [Asparagus officinalis]|uniref:rop guanine nucleotide exchange factor 14 n=1 Tax=Asparagus officinalis TaxID=4686 RepID=UPI00098E1A04|nr:rop guanine nucleotide exchange factor 14 [Asparagus officinalis]